MPHPLAYDPDALAAAAERLGLRMVVLFGSHATGQASEESDVDVAVLAGDPAVSLATIAQELAAVFRHADLDTALLNDADPLFRYEVLRSARLLYGDPDLFAEYEAYAYRDFVDSADLRALEEALSRKKLARLLDAAP